MYVILLSLPASHPVVSDPDNQERFDLHKISKVQSAEESHFVVHV